MSVYSTESATHTVRFGTAEATIKELIVLHKIRMAEEQKLHDLWDRMEMLQYSGEDLS